MAFMFADFTGLIALLNKHKAKNFVIGGYAVSRPWQPRATKNLAAREVCQENYNQLTSPGSSSMMRSCGVGNCVILAGSVPSARP